MSELKPSDKAHLSDVIARLTEHKDAWARTSIARRIELLRELMSDDLDFEALDIIEPSLEQIFAAHTSGGGTR